MPIIQDPGDVHLSAGRDGGKGRVVFSTGGVERASIDPDGTGHGFGALLGGSITATDGTIWTPLIGRLRDAEVYARAAKSSLDLGVANTGVHAELGLVGQGIVAETFSALLSNGNSALTTQSVYGFPFGLKAGTTVNGIMLRNATAAAGTLPTTARFGLADSSGKIVARSGNLNALANWAVGPMPFVFSSAYTIPYDGTWIGCFIVNGTWSVTQPTPVRQTGLQTAAMGAFASTLAPHFTWTGQTDLPAVDASLTMSGAAQFSYYVALY